jgi:hypothetical protein
MSTYTGYVIAASEESVVPLAPSPDEASKRLSDVHPPGGSVSAPMREFLVWVAFRPRTHADAMDAWQSHCPRFTLWEDALEAGLVDLELGSGLLGSARVRLTARGRAALDAR